MDESEFQRCLELFPLVRSRDDHLDLDSSRQSTSGSAKAEVNEWRDARDIGDKGDAFWDKLRMASKGKMGATEAERFCKAFQQVYNKLVYEELTIDAAQKLLSSSRFSGK